MIDNISNYIRETGVNARKASRVVAVASLEQKSRCLQSLGSSIDGARERIKEANAKDLDLAGKDSLDASLLDRLTMDDHTIDGMLAGLDQIDLLPDPVGEVTGLTFQRSGIQVGKMRVPLGVVAMIYESRPNVTIDAAALSIKSGNAVILRGGSEAFCSNTELAKCVNEALLEVDLPVDAVQLLKITDREAVGELLKLDKYIDVIVPRGGKGLIERVCNETNINVIKHLDGVCHVYVDDEVELKMALSVVFNSKVEKYGVCNAMETLLVHENIAASFLKKVSSDLSGAGVELRCCSMSQPICSNSVLADESDWSAEYLGPVLAIKIVGSLERRLNILIGMALSILM